MNRTASIAAGALLALAGASASAQIYVWTPGDFAPNGTFNRPFQMVQHAACAAPAGSEILISPGVYPEPARISEPCRLVANGGTVRLGARQSVTNLRVVSYNTHLFGDTIEHTIDQIREVVEGDPLLEALVEAIAKGIGATQWADGPRATQIGLRLAEDNADVVCLQEVWDVDHRNDILSTYQPAHWFYGGFNAPFQLEFLLIHFTLNSGLLVMSDHALMNAAQVVYNAESGYEDALATKSFVQSTIVKDGIPIGIFNTHTQAGSADDEDIVDTRNMQMHQLMLAVSTYRVANPTHPVVIVGDMNIDGLDWAPMSEYIASMRGAMTAFAPARDVAANMRCAPDWNACTSCAENELHHHFYPDENNNTRLDYLFYCDSLDGSTRIRPVAYTRREYQSAVLITEGGFSSRELSDHYGIVADFQITR